MKTHQTYRKPSSINAIKSLVLGCGVALACALPLAAQTTYTAVDLTPGGYGLASAASGGQAAGYTTAVPASGSPRAALWTGDGLIDLHPAVIGGAVGSRSAVTGFAGNLQVGWGAGSLTGNRSVALAWRDSAASASILSVPFLSWGSQALATDGNQIAGYAGSYARDNTTAGPVHAMLWNAATGAATDLGDGGKGAQALGVGGGKQVGYVIQGSFSAALWSGSSKSLVVIHPKGAVSSVANATDGAQQVGYSGYDVRIRAEANKGANSAIFNYATVWYGSAASATVIHPYPFRHSFATGVSGSIIVGYAADQASIGTPAYYHAIVWDAAYQATDLNAFLPAGFVGAQAFSVDQGGYIAGVMSTAAGERHAVLWIPNL